MALGYGVMRPDLGDAYCALGDELDLVHGDVHADGGHRSDARRPERAGKDAPGIPEAPRCVREGLNQIKGFSCRLPKGAFYTFPNIKQTGWPSKKLADALLDEAGVAALSGTAFGSFGEGYLRFSIANSIENIQVALDRIDQWTKKNL